jgi:hypothetical protein
MRRLICLLLILTLSLPAFAGIPSEKAMYVGGTLDKVLTKGDIGMIKTDDEKSVTFDGARADVTVPYDKVTALAYGQHAGRRVGQTVFWGAATLGIAALPILFSKKRRHYVTIEYTDDKGVAQAGIFEVGKDSVRTLLKTLEVRTGKKMEYEDEEAKKAGNK